MVNEEAELEQKESEMKKSKMNTFLPGTSVADAFIQPPSQYALQKLNTCDYVKIWYFSPPGYLDAAWNYDKSQANDTFSISKVDHYLTICSIASVRASHNILSDHELSFPEFLRARNCFLEYAKKASWPTTNLDALAKFFWFPYLQLPLGERIIHESLTRHVSALTGTMSSKLGGVMTSQSPTIAYSPPSPPRLKLTIITELSSRQVIPSLDDCTSLLSIPHHWCKLSNLHCTTSFQSAFTWNCIFNCNHTGPLPITLT